MCTCGYLWETEPFQTIICAPCFKKEQLQITFQKIYFHPTPKYKCYYCGYGSFNNRKSSKKYLKIISFYFYSAPFHPLVSILQQVENAVQLSCPHFPYELNSQAWCCSYQGASSWNAVKCPNEAAHPASLGQLSHSVAPAPQGQAAGVTQEWPAAWRQAAAAQPLLSNAALGSIGGWDSLKVLIPGPIEVQLTQQHCFEQYKSILICVVFSIVNTVVYCTIPS